MKIFYPLLAAAFLVYGCAEQPQEDKTAPAPKKDYNALRIVIDSIVRTTPGKVGVALINLNTGDSFSYNGNMQFAMFSTYKFPLALYMLHQAEEGKLSLSQEVKISKEEMQSYNRGRFVDVHKGGDVSVTVDSMIWYAMSYSDNITTDHLFRLAGGPAAVNNYIHEKGVTEIAIMNTVMEMGHGNLYKNNWCTPVAMTKLLRLFHDGKMVNEENKAYLLRYMEAAPSGAKRIRGLLPEGTIVAHKTGTGGTSSQGITEGVNDMGIITLPDGRQLALSVYINDIAADVAGGEAVIARIVRAVYDDAVK